MTDSAPAYRVIASRVIGGQSVRATLSTGFEDAAWDRFLCSVPDGQFQQSSLWAQAKRGDRWDCLRVIFDVDGGTVGGFQIQAKQTRIGKVGFLSRGPVLTLKTLETEAFVLDTLIGLVKSQRLAAVFFQPPDDGARWIELVGHRGFYLDRFFHFTDASMWVDLSGPADAWKSKWRTDRRAAVRSAVRLGTTVQEGGDADIPKFFELMQSSCQRQGVPPSPGTLEATQEMVRAFAKAGLMRMTFAVCQGEPVAAVLDVRFGKRFTTFKKGWNGKHGKHKPNVILTHDSMSKAHELGCTCFDFAGLWRPLAEALLAEKPLTPELENHYDAYKLGFGGVPKLLPPTMIYCRNPLFRLACRQIAAHPRLAEPFKRFANKL